jgi:hypothetical protein
MPARNSALFLLPCFFCVLRAAWGTNLFKGLARVSNVLAAQVFPLLPSSTYTGFQTKRHIVVIVLAATGRLEFKTQQSKVDSQIAELRSGGVLLFIGRKVGMWRGEFHKFGRGRSRQSASSFSINNNRDHCTVVVRQVVRNFPRNGIVANEGVHPYERPPSRSRRRCINDVTTPSARTSRARTLE